MNQAEDMARSQQTGEKNTGKDGPPPPRTSHSQGAFMPNSGLPVACRETPKTAKGMTLGSQGPLSMAAAKNPTICKVFCLNFAFHSSLYIYPFGPKNNARPRNLGANQMLELPRIHLDITAERLWTLPQPGVCPWSVCAGGSVCGCQGPIPEYKSWLCYFLSCVTWRELRHLSIPQFSHL